MDWQKAKQAWIQYAKARGTLNEKSLKGYIAAIDKYLSQDLPYKQYQDKLRESRPSRTHGHDKTALDQFFAFLVATGFIDEHPDPNYKPRGWKIESENRAQSERHPSDR